MKVQYYNPNPLGKSVGDCVIRALTKALNFTWEQVYSDLTTWGYAMADMPSSNAVWGAYLRNKGYSKHLLPDECPDCYTIGEFADDFSKGVYIVGTGTHVVTVSDGYIYDTWDSSRETPIYYFTRE